MVHGWIVVQLSAILLSFPASESVTLLGYPTPRTTMFTLGAGPTGQPASSVETDWEKVVLMTSFQKMITQRWAKGRPASGPLNITITIHCLGKQHDDRRARELR